MWNEFVKNHWYAAAISEELTPGQLMSREVLGERLVLFRLQSGELGALEDRCPHRNVSLSLGCVKRAAVQCGYHGLQFDTSGSCLHIPSGEKAPSAMRVPAYPVIDRYGYLWVWMGTPSLADESQVPDYSWQSHSDWVGRLTSRATDCSYVLALENVLDLSHASFVHGETVGSPQVAQTRPVVVVEDQTVTVHRVFPRNPLPEFYRKATGWDHADRTQTITYFGVNCVRLEITMRPVGDTCEDKVLRLMFGGPYTPCNAGSHLHFSSAYRNFNHDDAAMTEVLIGTIAKAYAEDVVFLEDQQKLLNRGLAKDNCLIQVDQGPVAATRILRRLIAQERAAASHSS